MRYRESENLSAISGGDRLRPTIADAESRRAPPRRLSQSAQGLKFQYRNTEIVELREQLLDEFGHRVKNNQEILLDLLEAARRKTGNSEARELLSDTSRRIKAMGAAQQLFYSVSNSTDVDARTFVETVCASVRVYFSAEVLIYYEVTNGSLAKETMIPLALILDELLANAAKHGINNRDSVSIHVGTERALGIA